MTGVIPSLTQIQTSATPTAVVVGEIVSLQAIDEAYLAGAVYMFSPSIERALKAMVTAGGQPVFEEMREGVFLLFFLYGRTECSDN